MSFNLCTSARFINYNQLRPHGQIGEITINSMATTGLPFEIWEHIFSYLSLNDLRSFADDNNLGNPLNGNEDRNRLRLQSLRYLSINWIKNIFDTKILASKFYLKKNKK